MKKIGMIFPGQGSQCLGMCKEFYDEERIVQELFETASSCLDQNFTRLCFASSEKELRETVNAQTSIFLVSASIAQLLKEKYKIVPDIVAGHSSGEYSALYTAGGMSFADSLYLLKKRASFMQDATQNQEGGMMAVLGLPQEVVVDICKKYDDSEGTEKVAQVVNFNTASQVVVSGTLPELEQIKLDVKAIKGKAIPLNVAGAFHSRMMQESEKAFDLYLVKVDFKDLQIPFVNNVAAKCIADNEDVKKSLVKQISSPVLWWQAMDQFKDMDIIIEVGPGDKLSRILKKEWPEKEIVSVNNYKDLKNLLVLFDKTLDDFKNEDDASSKSEGEIKSAAQAEVSTKAESNPVDKESDLESL
jgi:[acyl-carrier-protein] S-malonyltransferase